MLTLGSLLLIGNALVSASKTQVTPPSYLKSFTNVSIQSQSGSTLSGWYLKGKAHMGGILLMHGIRANRLQMLRRALFLNQAGYSILLFDFQSHGQSTGEKMTFGFLESKDVDAAFEYLHTTLENKSIGLIGVSLGGAAAILSDALTQADALVLESVYPSIQQAIDNRLSMRLGRLGPYLSPLLTMQLQPRLGLSTEDLKPIAHIHNANGAVFIISGKDDLHTTIEETKQLYKQASQPKYYWELEGAAHVDLHNYSEIEYQHRVLAFFAKHMNVSDSQSN